MLMPIAIDMYLPALPVIAKEFSVDPGRVQMTLSSYVLGFAIGQIFYGPMSDSIGRKPVILGGVLIFTLAAAACALSQTVDQLIHMRFLHGLSAASASVVINALMRDMFSKDEFSRMMSFVILVMTVAPLLAPIIGGALLFWLSWHAIFWTIAAASLVRRCWYGCLSMKPCRRNGDSVSICVLRWGTFPNWSATAACSVTCLPAGCRFPACLPF